MACRCLEGFDRFEGGVPGLGADLRALADAALDAAIHDPHDDAGGRQVGRILRQRGSDAALYRSLRRHGGVCAAVFRPRAVRRARRQAWITYDWDGSALAPGTPVPAARESP